MALQSVIERCIKKVYYPWIGLLLEHYWFSQSLRWTFIRIVNLKWFFQGCPLLFNIVIDILLEITLSLSNFSGLVLYQKIHFTWNLQIFLFGENADKIWNLRTILSNEAKLFGVWFSSFKCKILLQDWPIPALGLVIGSKVIKCVSPILKFSSMLMGWCLMKSRCRFKSLDWLLLTFGVGVTFVYQTEDEFIAY